MVRRLGKFIKLKCREGSKKFVFFAFLFFFFSDTLFFVVKLIGQLILVGESGWLLGIFQTFTSNALLLLGFAFFFWKSKFAHQFFFVAAGKLFFSSKLLNMWKQPTHYKPFLLNCILFTHIKYLGWELKIIVLIHKIHFFMNKGFKWFVWL